MLRKLALKVTTIAFALSCSTRAFSLCVEQKLANAFQSAEAVIAAKVIETRPHKINGWQVLTLSTQKIWKRSRTQTKTILAFDSPERPPFIVGEDYLMFLEKPIDGKLSIGKCSPRTRETRLAGDDIIEIEKRISSNR